MSHESAAGGLPQFQVYRAVSAALEEDLGPAGDITTNSIVLEGAHAKAKIVAREAGRVAGLQLAEAAFKTFDHGADFDVDIADGGDVEPGQAIARIEAEARALLTGERVALNFLGHLSGVATLTRSFVDAVADTRARICCTRKTLPGLRAFEKYAVRMGGGANHRFTLSDAVLIKDNHIAAAGDLKTAIEKATARAGHTVKIEVEVDNLDQLETALQHPIDAVLLDNMDAATLSRAVELVDGRVTTEASGGISLENVKEVAGTGVDLISIGGLTHSAPALDVALDWS